MYLLAKFNGHRSCRNRDINSYINFYIDTLEKAELTANISDIARFLQSGILIYIPRVLDTAGRRSRGRRKRTQAIVKRFTFYANAKTFLNYMKELRLKK